MILFLNYTFHFIHKPDKTLSTIVKVNQKRFNKSVRYRERTANRAANKIKKQFGDPFDVLFITSVDLTFTKD